FLLWVGTGRDLEFWGGRRSGGGEEAALDPLPLDAGHELALISPSDGEAVPVTGDGGRVLVDECDLVRLKSRAEAAVGSDEPIGHAGEVAVDRWGGPRDHPAVGEAGDG